MNKESLIGYSFALTVHSDHDRQASLLTLWEYGRCVKEIRYEGSKHYELLKNCIEAVKGIGCCGPNPACDPLKDPTYWNRPLHDPYPTPEPEAKRYNCPLRQAEAQGYKPVIATESPVDQFETFLKARFGYSEGQAKAKLAELDRFLSSLSDKPSESPVVEALHEAVAYIRNRHNMGRGTREQKRLDVLAKAAAALKASEIPDAEDQNLSEQSAEVFKKNDFLGFEESDRFIAEIHRATAASNDQAEDVAENPTNADTQHGASLAQAQGSSAQTAGNSSHEQPVVGELRDTAGGCEVWTGEGWKHHSNADSQTHVNRVFDYLNHPPQASDQPDDCRAEFEALATRYSLPLERKADLLPQAFGIEYDNEMTEYMRIGWQAALKLRPSVREQPVGITSHILLEKLKHIKFLLECGEHVSPRPFVDECIGIVLEAPSLDEQDIKNILNSFYVYNKASGSRFFDVEGATKDLLYWLARVVPDRDKVDVNTAALETDALTNEFEAWYGAQSMQLAKEGYLREFEKHWMFMAWKAAWELQDARVKGAMA